MKDMKLATLFIFLNKTCFNGLYRVNKNGDVNVSFGKRINPKICEAEAIFSASEILQKTIILQGDYTQTLEHAGKNSFYYLDPPYKPTDNSRAFKGYTREQFDDSEQLRLKDFCMQLTNAKAKWLMSNSDPKSINGANDFFDKLYLGPNFFLDRVTAKRLLQGNSTNGMRVSELLISNYPKPKS